MNAPAVVSLLDLSGRTALVTGASSAIGAAIARRLHEAGASVILHAHIDTSLVTPLAEELGTRVSVVCGDVERDARALCDSAVAAFGAVHILVNNAALQPVAPLLDIEPTDELEVLRVNAAGVAAMTRAAAALMPSADGNGDAAVINMASIEGLQPAAGHSHYAASKAAVIMHTRAAALELGSHGIRVNCVAPGLIDTGGLADRWPEGVRRWQAAAPLVRLGTPEDVADAVLFLASPAARWITGATLVVDGGVLASSSW